MMLNFLTVFLKMNYLMVHFAYILLLAAFYCIIIPLYVLRCKSLSRRCYIGQFFLSLTLYFGSLLVDVDICCYEWSITMVKDVSFKNILTNICWRIKEFCELFCLLFGTAVYVSFTEWIFKMYYYASSSFSPVDLTVRAYPVWCEHSCIDCF